MEGRKLVDRAAVCRELGISRQRLHVLIGEGRIIENARGIDLEAAVSAYKATIDPARRAAYEDAAAGGLASPKISRPGPHAGTSQEDGKPPIDFHAARTQKEIANANRAELEYRIKAGSVMPRDVVSAKEFAIARKLRDRILGFPARLANFVPPDAMSVITDECEALVREMQDDVAKIAEGE